MERLLELLESYRSDVDFCNETALIDDKILDSFDIVYIVSQIRDTFDVMIQVDDLSADNFNSVQTMWALITARMGEN